MMKLMFFLVFSCFKIFSSKELISPYLFIDLRNVHASIVFTHLNSGNYENMFIDEDILYLTGIDYVFKLNSIEINNKNSSNYYERDFKTTSNKGHNYIKFISIRKSNDLIICTTNGDKPLILHLEPHDLSFQYDFVGTYLCPGVEIYKNLALVSLKGVMYSAVWMTETITRDIFSRYGIFRKHTEEDKLFLKTLFSPFWLWEPRFINIFEDKWNVYYFFDEYSIEDYLVYENEEIPKKLLNQTIQTSLKYKRVSRVAKVCKNDNGFSNDAGDLVWSTYRKILIECRDRFRIFSNLNLINLLPVDNTTIIAIFDENTNFGVTSIFCEYKLNRIREEFSVKNFLNIKETNDFTFPNMEFNEQYNNLSNADYDFKQDVYDFLEKNTILNTKLVFDYRFTLDYKISSINIEKYSEKLQIIYAFTINGHLLKILRILDENVVYRLVTIFKFKNNENPVTETLFNEKLRVMYVSTNDQVLQIHLNKTYCFISAKNLNFNELFKTSFQ